MSFSVNVLILNSSVYSSLLQLRLCVRLWKTLSWNEVVLKRVQLKYGDLAFELKFSFIA